MKIKIGPFINWIGPYQLAEKLLFWIDKDKDDRVYDLGNWLSGGDKGDSWLLRGCSWIHSKRNRKIKVKIDDYDVWNMDGTLSYIILPMLKKLKESNNGAPFVDDGDVPEELRSTSAPPKINDWDTDENHFRRWDWVINEMIFAFELNLDADAESKFWKVHPELDLSKHEEDEGKITIPVRWKTEGICDREGLKKQQERATNGFRLFGKYFQSLWT